MNLYHLENGHAPRRLAADDPLPETGYVWADFTHDEAAGWWTWAEPRSGTPIDPQHIDDSLNTLHPSFFDGTSTYDMVIFQGLGSAEKPFPLETRVTSFFIFKRMLITICPHDSISMKRVRERLCDVKLKPPSSPLLLAHLMIDTMVDRFLAVREPMAELLTELQDNLLDPHETSTDWRVLLQGRKEVRRLEALSESQLEALDAWRRGSCFEWSKTLDVRVRDIVEHVTRVLHYAAGQERDLEAAVQLHFASVAHHTNKVIQVLTVLSAIFFPLTLLTGIYGMNFENMPELNWHYGYYYVLGMLATIGGSLYWYFRRRKFI